MLWIAFVLCTFGLIYSTTYQICETMCVVNCFRSLYLWVDLQLNIYWDSSAAGCELLSFFVPLGWFTAKINTVSIRLRLWIAFVLCTFGLIYSRQLEFSLPIFVVNCFRSLYLWVDLQHGDLRAVRAVSCELLSFFVPLGWFTAGAVEERGQVCCELLSFFVPLGWFTASECSVATWWQLWIAFVLCTFGLIYSQCLLLWWPITVVNCFRSLYLWVDLQRNNHMAAPRPVVNCFRSLYLWVDLQHFGIIAMMTPSCELLSFFVPLGWFTAMVTMLLVYLWLWIAFVLCTFGLIYS